MSACIGQDVNIEHQQHFHSSLPLSISHQYVQLYLYSVAAVLKTFSDGFSGSSLAKGECGGEGEKEEIGSMNQSRDLVEEKGKNYVCHEFTESQKVLQEVIGFFLSVQRKYLPY